MSEGEEPALQGLTTSLIDRAYHARLFTSVAVLEIVAKLVGGPVMGKLFSIIKNQGEGSMGICFSVSAVSGTFHLYVLNESSWIDIGSTFRASGGGKFSKGEKTYSRAMRRICRLLTATETLRYVFVHDLTLRYMYQIWDYLKSAHPAIFQSTHFGFLLRRDAECRRKRPLLFHPSMNDVLETLPARIPTGIHYSPQRNAVQLHQRLLLSEHHR